MSQDGRSNNRQDSSEHLRTRVKGTVRSSFRNGVLGNVWRQGSRSGREEGMELEKEYSNSEDEELVHEMLKQQNSYKSMGSKGSKGRGKRNQAVDDIHGDGYDDNDFDEYYGSEQGLRRKSSMMISVRGYSSKMMKAWKCCSSTVAFGIIVAGLCVGGIFLFLHYAGNKSSVSRPNVYVTLPPSSFPSASPSPTTSTVTKNTHLEVDFLGSCTFTEAMELATISTLEAAYKGSDYNSTVVTTVVVESYEEYCASAGTRDRKLHSQVRFLASTEDDDKIDRVSIFTKVIQVVPRVDKSSSDALLEDEQVLSIAKDITEEMATAVSSATGEDVTVRELSIIEAPSFTPSVTLSLHPSVEPSMTPTSKSPSTTNKPTAKPTARPTESPTTKTPSMSPVESPSPNPTVEPSSRPSRVPSENPSRSKTMLPSGSPHRSPSASPSRKPTDNPSSGVSSESPSSSPTSAPTGSGKMTSLPSSSPTSTPTPSPSFSPSNMPSSSAPTHGDTSQYPTQHPSPLPSESTTENSSMSPSQSPTKQSSMSPSQIPTKHPTKAPSQIPTKHPTKAPSKSPTKQPTKAPSKSPTKQPTKAPSQSPTEQPTKAPSKSPTKAPSKSPTKQPTKSPSESPTEQPSVSPSYSSVPSQSPSVCSEDPLEFFFSGYNEDGTKTWKRCNYLDSVDEDTVTVYCSMTEWGGTWAPARVICPISCSICTP